MLWRRNVPVQTCLSVLFLLFLLLAILSQTRFPEYMCYKIKSGVKGSEQRWDRYIYQTDCERLGTLVSEFKRASEGMPWPQDKMKKLFYPLISYPVQTGCQDLKRIGGHFDAKGKAWDGDKMVCLDDFKDEECLIYSFGLGEDWSFEDIMAKQGCKVKAFDPTVEDLQVPGVQYHHMGLGDTDDPKAQKPLKTLKTILKENGDTDKVITYMKIDIEGGEAKGFPKWIKDGSLDNVLQIGVELHVKMVDEFIKIVLALLEKGFKPISYMANQAVLKKKSNDYYRFMEVVFRRTVICNGTI